MLVHLSRESVSIGCYCSNMLLNDHRLAVESWEILLDNMCQFLQVQLTGEGMSS